MEKQIFRAFKNKGLSLTTDASKLLQQYLIDNGSGNGLEVVLDRIKESMDKKFITSSIISVAVITDVTTADDNDKNDNNNLHIIDAFHTPKLIFDEKNKTYRLEQGLTYPMYPDSHRRAEMYKQRLLLALQRLYRSGIFIQEKMSNANTNNSNGSGSGGGGTGSDSKIVLSTIDSLLGSSGTKVLFGMLTQPEEGAWFLEDLGSLIQLNLSSATCYGICTGGNQVIISGELIGRTFAVSEMFLPPSEGRDVSLSHMGLLDNFGCFHRQAQRLQSEEAEAAAIDSLFIIVSDVQLDKLGLIERLQVLFERYEQQQSYMDTPILFILIGNFISLNIKSGTTDGRESITSAFTSLADVICMYPNIQTKANFVLVAGPTDPGPNVSLPRRALPSEFVKELKAKVGNVYFVSNPCRIRFCSQEIVLFREDLMKKVLRHSILPIPTGNTTTDDDDGDGDDGNSNSGSNVKELYVDSLIYQGHLCPLPLHIKPIFWDYDHAMRLTPLPHLLVLADNADQFEHHHKGCIAVNPGAFAVNYSYLEYRPALKAVEFKSV